MLSEPSKQLCILGMIHPLVHPPTAGVPVIAVGMLDDAHAGVLTSRAPFGVRVAIEILLSDAKRRQLTVNVEAQRHVKIWLALTVKLLELFSIHDQVRILV